MHTLNSISVTHLSTAECNVIPSGVFGVLSSVVYKRDCQPEILAGTSASFLLHINLNTRFLFVRAYQKDTGIYKLPPSLSYV